MKQSRVTWATNIGGAGWVPSDFSSASPSIRAKNMN